MLKQKLLIITTLLCILIPVHGFAFDGTGIWDYTEGFKTNTCGEPNIQESGEVGILQTGSTFIIIDALTLDWAGEGTISGNTYTFSDTWCEGDGTVTQTLTIVLSSDTYGVGSVYWTYIEGGYKCDGNHNFTVSKQLQAAPVSDATGKWNFTQSGLVDYCGDFPTPPATGYLDVTQTGNKITATDNLGNQYNGFVDGSDYTVLRSYLPQGGGRMTEWGMLTLNSETQGSGKFGFAWDDDCYECWGNWNISLTKEVPVSTYTITASASAGGTISPSGGVTVVAGESQGFQITPASGYTISDVLVDNSSVGAVTSYTFSNVSADHTISVVFKRIPFLSFLSILLE